jgi:hypothetical protein
MQSSPHPYYLVHLMPIYLPQHPILEHTEPLSVPLYE